jgi:hypothetical protein
MIDENGWHYERNPPDGGDSRKLCTIDVDGDMCFVGIRMWNSRNSRWESNGQPCAGEKVRAWRDLPDPARGHWDRGLLTVALVDQPDCITSSSMVNRGNSRDQRT